MSAGITSAFVEFNASDVAGDIGLEFQAEFDGSSVISGWIGGSGGGSPQTARASESEGEILE